MIDTGGHDPSMTGFAPGIFTPESAKAIKERHSIGIKQSMPVDYVRGVNPEDRRGISIKHSVCFHKFRGDTFYLRPSRLAVIFTGGLFYYP